MSPSGPYDFDDGEMAMNPARLSLGEAESLIDQFNGFRAGEISSRLSSDVYVLGDKRVLKSQLGSSSDEMLMWNTLNEFMTFHCGETGIISRPDDVVLCRFPNAEQFVLHHLIWGAGLCAELQWQGELHLNMAFLRWLDDRLQSLGEQALSDRIIFCGLTAIIGMVNCKFGAYSWNVREYGNALAPANETPEGRIEFPFYQLLQIEDGWLWGDKPEPDPFRPMELSLLAWPN